MIHIQSISKQFGSQILFETAEAHLGPRSRVALIGPNGSGKSTLIKMLLGMEAPDSGRITRVSHLAIGYLAQEVPKFADRTVLDEVMRLDGRREELLVLRKELEEKLAKTGPTATTEGHQDDLERLGRVLEELEHLDEYRLESRAKEILLGIGFKSSDFHRSLSEFSGGWLMRVALSRILLMDADFLLLDEPTNHLDLESLLWLEEFLRGFHGAMLIVSHDTAFLNRTVNEVLEIDQKKIWSYRGNLEAYAVQKEERLTLLRAQYAGQQAKIAEIEAFVSRFGAKATKARQAQSRLKQLEKMERIELPDARKTVRFRFPPAPHSGKDVVSATHVSLRYDGEGGETRVFEDLNWIIRRGSRIAVVGPNGAGKTTLLKLLSGRLGPSGGEVRFGQGVRVGYYAQFQAEALDLGKTVLQELEQVTPDMPVSQVRAIAGAFLFTGDAVEKRCAALSGGEKARVALAKLLLSPANLLILDEPTNHLDVESRGVLLEALQDFDGTLCVVSHDRDFVAPLIDKVLEIIPSPDPARGSEVVQLIEGYEDYLERKRREIARTVQDGEPGGAERDRKTAAPRTPARTGPSNNQKRAWETERDRLEKEIAGLEARQAEVGGVLAGTAIYDDQAALMKLIAEQKLIAETLEKKISRWEEVCTMLEG